MQMKDVFRIRKNRPWVPADDVQIRKMLLAGLAVAAIARRLRRTGGAIRNRARLLDMSASDNIAFRHARNRRLEAQKAPAAEVGAGE
jgi:hypothetical protein